MAARGLHHVKNENYAFMTCVLRVNTRAAGWQKTVTKVLNNVKGVSNCRIAEDGKVEVSGTVDPNLLLMMLAKAGKRAELCWFQFGECSSNLYMPNPQEYYDYSKQGYYGDDGYYGYGGPTAYYGGDYGASNYYQGDYGASNYYGDERYLHYDGYVDRPRPTYSHRPFQHMAHEYRNRHELRGENFSLRLSPRVNTPLSTSEGVSCCSLM